MLSEAGLTETALGIDIPPSLSYLGLRHVVHSIIKDLPYNCHSLLLAHTKLRCWFFSFTRCYRTRFLAVDNNFNSPSLDACG